MLRALPRQMINRPGQDSVTEESPSRGADITAWDTTKDMGRVAWNVGVPVAIVAGAFVPLVRQVVEIAFALKELCRSAKYNSELCEYVSTHVSRVSEVVKPLEESYGKGKQGRYTEGSYQALERLKNTMGEIQTFVKNISTTEGMTKIERMRRALHGPSLSDRLKHLLHTFDENLRMLEAAVNIGSSVLLDERLDLLIRRSERTQELVESMGSGFETMKMAVKKHNERGVRELFDERLLEIGQYEQRSVESLMDDRRVYKWFRKCDGLPVAFRHVDFSQQDEEKEKRLRREITILRMLQQQTPDVTRYYGITEDNGKRYIVTEWPTYGSLRTYYHNLKHLDDRMKKFNFAVQIARGLAYLCDVGILHHDVRSDNVVVTSHEHVKLANFGLSRFVRDSTKNVARLRERVRYMAPEKLENEKHKYDYMCEVYSFGLLLWEIVELQRPFGENAISDIEHGDDSSKSTRTQVKDSEEMSSSMRTLWLTRKKKPLEFSKEGVPDGYKRISSDAQEKDPGFRPKMFAVLDELERVLRRENALLASTPPPESPSTSSFSVRTPMRGYSTDNFEANGELLPLDYALKQYRSPGERGERALQSLKKYASLDQTEAMFHLAIHLLTASSTSSGNDNPPHSDPSDASPYTDDTIADYQVNIAALSTDSLTKVERKAIACKLLKQAAEAGHGEAQCRYGTILFHGNAAIKKNVEKARYYLTLSDINGHKNASYYLGMLHEQEDNDKERAIEYFKKAALLGVSQAVRTLESRDEKLT